MRQSLLLLLCLSLTGFGEAIAQSDDRSQSPYFSVSSADSSLEQLPLRHSEAEVHIAGIIADVRITQVYQNLGSRPIEAVYVFPASTRAAVYAMKMTIGEREIQAEIKEKGEAREIYTEAQSKGQTASLLEQHRPNVFQMSVANIMPGDSIVVEMSYTELLLPVAGEYEFVYPTVVGPRYTGPQRETTNVPAPMAQTTHFHEGELPSYTFDLRAYIQAGMPVQKAYSPTHQVQIVENESGAIEIRLDSSELFGGNRDLILRYRLRGEGLQSGLLTYQEKGEKFFLSLIEPPARVEPEAILPREYVFIIDVSGSMNGFPLNVSKKLMRDLLGGLRPTDRFNLLLFAGGNKVWAPEGSKPAKPKQIEAAIQFLNRETGGGGTQLISALRTALALPSEPGISRSFVICTDGYVTVEQEAFDLIRKEGQEANLFAFGIGSSVNRHLIEGLARAGKGEPFVVLNQQEAPAIAKRFQAYIQSPVLREVVGSFGEMEVYDLEPLNIPDVFAERPIAIIGKYRGQVKGEVFLSGKTAEGTYQQSIPLESSQPQEVNRAIRYLWAREKLQRLSDLPAHSPTKQAQITELGLQYNLLTEHTSFVAVHKKRRNQTESDTLISQPLPLPQGVSDQAVSASSSGAYSQALAGTMAGVNIQIRGARNSSTVTYIDGAKIRGISSLDEVIVVGYGSQTKSVMTGSVSSVYEEHLHSFSSPPSNFQGRLPGVQVSQSSGFPGAAANIRIRGTSSIVSNGEPLYVIDGQIVGQGTAPHPFSTAQLDPLLHLNPADISSITVLKDARATAQYGSRAANGVILIQTHTPRLGDQGWQLTSQWGGQMLKNPTKTFPDLPDSLFQAGFTQQYHLSYRKRTAKKKFYASLGYQDELGVVQDSRFQNLTARLQGEKPIHKSLKVGLRLSGGRLQADEGLWQLGITQNRWQGLGQLSGTWTISPNLILSSQLSGEGSQEEIARNTGVEQAGLTNWRSLGHRHALTLRKQWGAHNFRLQSAYSQQDMKWAQSLSERAEQLNGTQQDRLTDGSLLLDYQLRDRYSLSFSTAVAHTRNSLNGPAAVVLPSVSVAWSIDEEEFFPNQAVISQLRLKGSWGQQAQLPAWNLVQMDRPLSPSWSQNFVPFLWELPANASPWEITQQRNLELEVGLWNNRLVLTTGYYHKTTEDMWLPVPVSREGLWINEIQQLARVRNQGWEGKLAYVWYEGDWRASLGLNLSYNQNQVLEMEQESQVLGEHSGIPAWLLIEAGQPLGTIYGYQTQADGQLANERSVLGNTLPSWTYGIPIDVSWRNFSLDLLLHGFSGQDVLRIPTEASAQAPLTDAWLSKGRFLRCQQLQLSFHVPNHHLRGIKGMSFQLQGDNLWLLSGYDGYDPEVNAFAQNRMLLSSIDQAVFPRSSRISLGVKLDW